MSVVPTNAYYVARLIPIAQRPFPLVRVLSCALVGGRFGAWDMYNVTTTAR